MAGKRRNRQFGKSRQRYLGKPGGVIQDRVQQARPERFGILAVDCAKMRSKWMLCNFYGKVLVEPTPVEHNSGCLLDATEHAKQACRQAGLVDSIVAVEMTGVYHRPVQRAFRKAGFETRLVHPFASNHYRQVAHPDLKTDDSDLEAIFLAASAGFGLTLLDVDPIYRSLMLLSRHRRNLVKQRARLQTQIRVYLHRSMPGYADLFDADKFWTSTMAIPLARFAGSAAAMRKAGASRLAEHLRQRKLGVRRPTIERILAWAASAAEADPMSSLLTWLWHDLDHHRQQMTDQIRRIEREIAGFLVQTPYVLLLTVTGINVVSAGELAGEAGPIEHYASSRAITGRAGLFPSRYQSDQVDHADGPLAKTGNKKLRAACLRVAENLIKCHPHYRGLSAKWRGEKKHARDCRCRVANRAMRMVFQIVSGPRVYLNSQGIDRQYLLAKLIEFHGQHQTPPDQLLVDLRHATDQLPRHTYHSEAVPLIELSKRRRRGPRPLGGILTEILLRLGVGPDENLLESTTSEVRGPH